MKKIRLTRGTEAIVDDIDFDLSDYRWRENIGYAVREIRPDGTKRSRTSQYMHRVILERIVGRGLHRGELCDHINRDGLDNRRCNLRLVNKSQNNANGVKKSGKYKGVTFIKKLDKWRAQIMKNYKQIHIGCFDTEIEAAKAYNEKATELFGEYALLNEV